MDIVRNADGTLVVPLREERKHENDDDGDTSSSGADGEATQTEAAPGTRLLHPGEGGYDEALAEWDLQHHPDRAPVVSTASGRQEAALGGGIRKAPAAVAALLEEAEVAEAGL